MLNDDQALHIGLIEGNPISIRYQKHYKISSNRSNHQAPRSPTMPRPKTQADLETTPGFTIAPPKKPT
jgi:hypothetical protein